MLRFSGVGHPGMPGPWTFPFLESSRVGGSDAYGSDVLHEGGHREDHHLLQPGGAAFANGLDVVLLDFDSQEGSLGIADHRCCGGRPGWPVSSFHVTVSDADRLSVLKAEDPRRLLFCDLPGADSMALVRLLAEMDLIISPVGSGVSDLIAAANLASSVRGMRLELPLVFLPNNVTYIPQRRRALLEELRSLGVDVCPVWVQHRVAHLDCLRSGLGVCEAYPNSPAAADIGALWDWICLRLGLRTDNTSQGSFHDDAAGSEVAYSVQG